MASRTLTFTFIAGFAAVAVFAAPAAAGKRARTAKSKPAASKAVSNEGPGNGASKEGQAAATAKVANDSAGKTDSGSPPAAGKPRVYTFGGLDVTGTLKAPQMLYFRGRVSQELDTSSPEKRSFLKELERTADAKGL